jgi:Flp pilus assembly protein TadD
MDLETSRSLHQLALTALEEGRLEESVLLLRSAVRDHTPNPQAWNDLGIVMEILGNPSQAAECYSRALCMNPFHREARSNLLGLEMQTMLRKQMKQQAAQIVMSRIKPASSEAKIARAISA